MPVRKTRSAQVLYNGTPAGILTQSGTKYTFVYHDDYLQAKGSRPVSITLPLRSAPYETDHLFPAFVNMLSEGANKALQCRLLKIDENDYFSLLLATAGEDSIGPITIKEST
jgi:serine/threonine-protein kinase HipA